MEALLGLVGALSSSSSGCNALAEAGIVPALLPLIKDQNPDHVGLLGSAVCPCMQTPHNVLQQRSTLQANGAMPGL